MLELAQRGLSYAEIAAALDVPVHTVLALGLAATRGLLAAVDAEPAVSAVPLPTSARWGRVSALFRLPSRPDSAAT
ncbi:MAG: hypothetical protein M3Z02_01575 [Actinomycetota bacterium]|nr:hypothetical protein [Actinomycetota bacterium]